MLKTLLERRSCRNYNDKKVPKELLDQILEAGLYAASGRNRQAPVFVLVEDEKTVELLSKMNRELMGTNSDPFYNAKTLIIVLSDKNVPTYLYDGALAMGNMMNAAFELGVSSCWIHRAKEEFESEEGKALLEKWGIHGNYEGIGHLILGYTDEETPKAPKRKENRIYRV